MLKTLKLVFGVALRMSRGSESPERLARGDVNRLARFDKVGLYDTSMVTACPPSGIRGV